jgi:hypothetical protein
MIVGAYFDGDNNKDTQMQQHECYGEALRAIMHGCVEEYTKANFALGDESILSQEQREMLNNGCDHRTLQAGHDFLAAYWRWITLDTERDRVDWLIWLGKEAKSWQYKAPDISNSIITILLNQNTETGYGAEEKLIKSLEEHYKGMPTIRAQRKELNATEDSWKEFEREMREHKKLKEEERKQKYAERNLIGEIVLFLSELWLTEKDAWASHKWPDKEGLKEFGRGVSGLVLMTLFILVFSVGLMGVVSVFGFSFYVGHGDESPTRVALYAIFAAAFCSFILVYILISDVISKNRRRDLPKLTAKDIKPYWTGTIFCLIYAMLSVLIDWITGNYLYDPESNYFLQFGLMGIYGLSAFFTFYFWARVARFGPFSM